MTLFQSGTDDTFEDGMVRITTFCLANLFESVLASVVSRHCHFSLSYRITLQRVSTKFTFSLSYSKRGFFFIILLE